jgi:hypothetical protein
MNGDMQSALRKARTSFGLHIQVSRFAHGMLQRWRFGDGAAPWLHDERAQTVRPYCAA